MSANGKDLITRMDRVCMAYHGHQVLFDVSMDVGKREFLTILGPIGCGKTTILRLLGGFEPSTSGESNIFEGVMPKDGEVEFCGKRSPYVDVGFSQNEPVYVLIRLEDVQTVDPWADLLKSNVQSVVLKGVHYEMIIRENGHQWLIHSTRSLKVGVEISLCGTPI